MATHYADLHTLQKELKFEFKGVSITLDCAPSRTGNAGTCTPQGCSIVCVLEAQIGERLEYLESLEVA